MYKRQLFGFTAGTRVPRGLSKAVHPLVTCTAVAMATAATIGRGFEVGFTDMLRAYVTKSRCVGGGVYIVYRGEGTDRSDQLIVPSIHGFIHPYMHAYFRFFVHSHLSINASTVPWYIHTFIRHPYIHPPIQPWMFRPPLTPSSTGNPGVSSTSVFIWVYSSIHL